MLTGLQIVRHAYGRLRMVCAFNLPYSAGSEQIDFGLHCDGIYTWLGDMALN